MNSNLQQLIALQKVIPGCCNTQRYLELMDQQADLLRSCAKELGWSSPEVKDAILVTYQLTDKLSEIYHGFSGPHFVTAHNVRRKFVSIHREYEKANGKATS